MTDQSNQCTYSLSSCPPQTFVKTTNHSTAFSNRRPHTHSASILLINLKLIIASFTSAPFVPSNVITSLAPQEKPLSLSHTTQEHAHLRILISTVFISSIIKVSLSPTSSRLFPTHLTPSDMLTLQIFRGRALPLLTVARAAMLLVN